MPPFGPISRRKLVRALKDAGFSGPHPGSDHEIMQRGDIRYAFRIHIKVTWP